MNSLSRKPGSTYQLTHQFSCEHIDGIIEVQTRFIDPFNSFCLHLVIIFVIGGGFYCFMHYLCYEYIF